MKTIIILIALILGMYFVVSLFDVPGLTATEELRYRYCSLSGGVPLITSDDMVVCVSKKKKKNDILP